jgi:hypothetical protein
MGKFDIINAPLAFPTAWSIVKPWLDEMTVAKIDIVSSGMSSLVGRVNASVAAR